MKKAAVSTLAILLLPGCATVSMVSKQAVVESETSATQSLMHERADAYKQTAEEAGWVSESRGLADFANILFGGNSEQTDRAPANYAERISAAEADVAAVFSTVSDDAARASDGLTALDTIATDLLEKGDVGRNDLISFESALVVAQKSYRSFAEATGIAESRGKTGLDEAEAALATLANAIDTARLSADALASAYAEATPAGAAS